MKIHNLEFYPDIDFNLNQKNINLKKNWLIDGLIYNLVYLAKLDNQHNVFFNKNK
jgi:hypothetical protein